MATKGVLTVTAALILAWLSLAASAQGPHWSYPYAPYGYGLPAAPMPPGYRMVPVGPMPPAAMPDSRRYPSGYVDAPRILPLSRLGRELERIGYATVYKAEWKDGLWEFLAEGGGGLAVITLNPHTGRLLSRKSFRPAPELAFSHVVNRLEKEGYTPISEVEFEDGVWEIEAAKDGDTAELVVELVSGQIKIRTAD